MHCRPQDWCCWRKGSGATYVATFSYLLVHSPTKCFVCERVTRYLPSWSTSVSSRYVIRYLACLCTVFFSRCCVLQFIDDFTPLFLSHFLYLPFYHVNTIKMKRFSCIKYQSIYNTFLAIFLKLNSQRRHTSIFCR